MASIAAVVPCFPPHMVFVRRLVRDLLEQESRPDEIVIAASGINKLVAGGFHQSLRRLGSEVTVKMTAVSERQTPGQNRNRGASMAECDYVMFLDADDTYHKSKTSVMRTLADRFAPTLILHSYVVMPERMPESMSWNDQMLVHNEEILRRTFGTPPSRNLDMETGKNGDTNLLPGRHIAHGAATVRRDVFRSIRYTNMVTGEDGRFCRDVCWNLGGVVYMDLPLIAYRIWYSRSLTQRLMRRLSQV